MGQKINVLYSVHSLFSEVFFSSSEERWVLGQCSNNAFSINAPRFTAGRGGRLTCVSANNKLYDVQAVLIVAYQYSSFPSKYTPCLHTITTTTCRESDRYSDTNNRTLIRGEISRADNRLYYRNKG